MAADALYALAATRKVRQGWRPPTREDLRLPQSPEIRWVVAADQSLRGCGLVLLGAQCDGAEASVAVRAAQKVVTEPGTTGGHEDTLRRAVGLYERLRAFFARVQEVAGGVSVELVHEHPPIATGRIRRPEASLLASLALRLAAPAGVVLQEMVSAATHKRALCGDRQADKRTQHAALKLLATDLGIGGMHLITNEDLRDALAIGLYHLTREPRRGEDGDG